MKITTKHKGSSPVTFQVTHKRSARVLASWVQLLEAWLALTSV